MSSTETDPEMLAVARLTKQALRKGVKARVAALSDAEKLRQSQIVTQMLLSSPEWVNSDRVSMFLSMSDEINTSGIMSTAFHQNKKLFIPRYIGDNMEMLRLYSAEDYESLPETAWKIKQPTKDDVSRDEAISTGGLDLVLMPGLAFSPATGLRLGRGKGYYDRFLHGYKEKLGQYPFTVALAFNEQIYDDVPCHSSDVPVNRVLYEKSSEFLQQAQMQM